jgi:hypothetical protein
MPKKLNDPSIVTGTPAPTDKLVFFNPSTGKISSITLADLQAIAGWSNDTTTTTTTSTTIP